MSRSLVEFDALFVGKFGETPEHAATAGGAAMMETVPAPLLLAVANGEVGLSAQRLNSLIDQGFGLAGVFLVRRKHGCGLGRLRIQTGVRRSEAAPRHGTRRNTP